MPPESKRGGGAWPARVWCLRHGMAGFDVDYTGAGEPDDEKINLGSLPAPLSPYNIA
ncbi:hypothetical protein [Duganella sp. CF517]|uniref:hypothetical protein n=1 Tax=Duganella sp. CF517 TaxID=1881038 RepID=UPI0015A66B49|nr:hypothetical protein [Duganella sp. CF517]